MSRLRKSRPSCPGLFAEKVIEWLYWDIPQFGVLRSRTLLARAEALSCYANVASRFLVLTRTPCVQPWLASSSQAAPAPEGDETLSGRNAGSSPAPTPAPAPAPAAAPDAAELLAAAVTLKEILAALGADPFCVDQLTFEQQETLVASEKGARLLAFSQGRLDKRQAAEREEKQRERDERNTEALARLQAELQREREARRVREFL